MSGLKKIKEVITPWDISNRSEEVVIGRLRIGNIHITRGYRMSRDICTSTCYNSNPDSESRKTMCG